jgi:hypothetical protein
MDWGPSTACSKYCRFHGRIRSVRSGGIETSELLSPVTGSRPVGEAVPINYSRPAGGEV